MNETLIKIHNLQIDIVISLVLLFAILLIHSCVYFYFIKRINSLEENYWSISLEMRWIMDRWSNSRNIYK